MASGEPAKTTAGNWTFVNIKGEEEEVDEGSCSSSASSEFVRLGDEGVSYHHVNKGSAEAPASDSELSSVSEDEKGQKSDQDPVSFCTGVTQCQQLSRAEAESHNNTPLPDISDVSLVGNTSPSEMNLSSRDSVSSAELVGSASCSTESSDLDSDVEVITHEDPSEGERNGDGSREDPSSKVEEDENEITTPEAGIELASVDQSRQQGTMASGSLESSDSSDNTTLQMRLFLRPQVLTDSDSESDFAHLESHSSGDPSELEDFPNHQEHIAEPSVDLGFQFVRQEQDQLDGERDVVRNEPDAEIGHNDLPADHHGESDEDADAATESGAEDDRIESDQSDSIPAEDGEDSDLSFSDIGLENISLHEVNRSRQYVHRPNTYLSGTLSLVVIMAGWMALGLGIGHLLGSANPNMHQAVNQGAIDHAKKIHQIQDELFLCLGRKADITGAFRRQRREWDNQEAALINMLTSCGKTSERLLYEAQDLKMKVNELEQSKTDLVSEIGRLKYNRHPGNVGGEADRDTEGSSVKTSNSDAFVKGGLKIPILKGIEGTKVKLLDDLTDIENGQKEVSEPSDDNSLADELLQVSEEAKPVPTLEWENQTEKLKAELSLAKGQADMWHQLYLTERQRTEQQGNNTPDVLTCLALFTPNINLSEVVQALNTTIVQSIGILPNISNLTNYVNDTWGSRKLFSTISEFQLLFEELSKIWLQWQWGFKEDNTVTKSEWVFEDILEAPEDKNQGNDKEEAKQYVWSKSLNDFLNETQRSVVRISREIQEKWEEMKHLSEDLWDKHKPTIGYWQENLSRQISKLGNKIKEKIQKKSSRWFGKAGKPHHKKKRHQKKDTLRKQPRKSKGGKAPNRKNKKMSRKHKKNQKYKKHNRAFKRIFKQWYNEVKHIGSVSKKGNALPDVNLNHFCGGISEFQYEYDWRFPDKKSEQWVRCQTGWWCSRHLNTPFSRRDVCTKFLFKWQLKFEKKENKIRNLKDKVEISKNRHETSADKGQKSKVKENGDAAYYRRKDGERHGVNKGRNCKRKTKEHARKNEYHQTFGRTKRRRHANEGKKQGRTPQKQWDGTNKQNCTEQDSSTGSGEWYFKNRPTQEELERESRYFKVREEGRKRDRYSRQSSHDTEWFFNRAEDREFHHKTPDNWYFRRVEGRRRDKERRRARHAHREDDDHDYGQQHYYKNYDFVFC